MVHYASHDIVRCSTPFADQIASQNLSFLDVVNIKFAFFRGRRRTEKMGRKLSVKLTSQNVNLILWTQIGYSPFSFLELNIFFFPPDKSVRLYSVSKPFFFFTSAHLHE